MITGVLDAAGDGVSSAYFAELKREEFFAYHSSVSRVGSRPVPDRVLTTGTTRRRQLCAGSSGCTCATRSSYPQLGELLTGMLCEMADRGSDSAGVAVYGDPTWSPPGTGCVSLLDVDATAAELIARPSSAATGHRRRGDASIDATLPAVRRRRRRGPAGRCAGRRYPDALVAGFGARPRRAQGRRPSARRSTDAWGLPSATGLAGRRAHPDGHRVGGDARRAPTRTRSGPTSAWCTTARSPTTPPSGANCARPGCGSTARTTPRSGARFVAQQLAAGRDVETALKELCATFDGFYTLLVSNRRLVRRGPRRDRLQARRDRRDRRLGGDGQRVPRAGRPARRRATPRIWEPEPEVVYAWTR